MEALILSCGTGGGHNMAGKAVADELKNRGHTVTFIDPYQLVGKNTADHVGKPVYQAGSAFSKSVRMVLLYGGILSEVFDTLPRILGKREGCRCHAAVSR